MGACTYSHCHFTVMSKCYFIYSLCVELYCVFHVLCSRNDCGYKTSRHPRLCQTQLFYPCFSSFHLTVLLPPPPPPQLQSKAMPSPLKLKYNMMHHRIHLKNGEPLGIIVSSDWKHRYMIVKGVRPNSQGDRLGIERGDRLFAIDDFIGQELTMKTMDAVLKKKRHFVMTVLRKKTHCSKRPKAVSSKQTSVKGTRLDFGNPQTAIKETRSGFVDPQTYCVKSARQPFSIHASDQMENSRKAESEEAMDAVSQVCETCDLRTEEEKDWDSISITTCQSGKNHFAQQRMNNLRTKMGDITNDERMKAHYQNNNNNNSSRIQADLRALQEQSDKGEQFMRRYRVSDFNHYAISRVGDWVDRHSNPSFNSNADYEDDKENITPNSIWRMHNWKRFG